MVAGHSLGEYAALTAAGSLALEDAVRLVRVRADAMQAAVPVGTGAIAILAWTTTPCAPPAPRPPRARSWRP